MHKMNMKKVTITMPKCTRIYLFDKAIAESLSSSSSTINVILLIWVCYLSSSSPNQSINQAKAIKGYSMKVMMG